MASGPGNQRPRPTDRRSIAPALFLAALVGGLAWGLWQWRRAPDGGAGPAREPVPTRTSNAVAAVSSVIPVEAPSVPPPSTSAPPWIPLPVPAVPTGTVAVIQGLVPSAGITSAPLVLSTQVFRAQGSTTGVALAAVQPPAATSSASNPPPAWVPRGATNLLEAQIALAGLGFSPGSIDGVGGAQTAAALKAFQSRRGLEQSGRLDRDTRRALVLRRPPLGTYRVTAEDLLRLAPVPDTWVGKSQVAGLEHETLIERLAERFQAHPAWLRRINPGLDWDRVGESGEVTVPALAPVAARRAGLVRIDLDNRFLRVFDAAGDLIAHFPCSIARRVEKRPVGDLQVVVTVPNPDYTWDPEVFPESPESRTVGRRLRLPPGPNNPVGVAWIGLNRPGYGIHGTPKPEEVGRTESHGCFRLSNWNAELLRRMAWPGLPVRVEAGSGVPMAAATPALVATNGVRSQASSTSSVPAGPSLPPIRPVDAPPAP